MTDVATGPGPVASDFVSLGSRMRSLVLLRLVFASTALVTGLLRPGEISPGLVVSSVAYAGLEIVCELIRRGGKGRRLAILGFEVLVDGVFLTWITYLTGGALSPFQLFLYVHVIAISLLASYRTGLKVAVWDSLLLVAVVNGVSSGTLAASPTMFGGSPAPNGAWVDHDRDVVGRHDRDRRAVRRERAEPPEEARRHVLAHGDRRRAWAPRIEPTRCRASSWTVLHDTFEIDRSLLLASPVDDLALLASRGTNVGPIASGMDRVVERALTTRSTQVVRRLDPALEPRLAALIPDARNLLIVPLFLAGGFRLGVLVVEGVGRGDTISGWTVEIIQQFASHAAVRLHNAWLLDDNRRKLGEIQRLKDELMVKNLSLESTVIERTVELDARLEQLRGSDAERERLLSHLLSAQEDERRRIAGDIHDDPLQLLVAVTMRLDIFRRELGDPAQVEHISELREWIRAAVAKLRNLMFELRPPILDEEGLAAAIDEYATYWNLEQSVTIHDGFSEEPPEEQRLLLYRIAQEAFANIRKHAKAASIDITLEQQDQIFLVRMVDDGVGFDPGRVVGAKDGHIGLSSMRERAEMAGGGCRIQSLPGEGTTVEFWVPTTLQNVDVSPRSIVANGR